MTPKKVAQGLEKRFKGDIHISIDTVQQFIKEEIKPYAFTVLDVSKEYKYRMLKTTMQLKPGQFCEFYIKPL